MSGTGDSSVLNEVFAHSAMLRHRHVVRYYSSWVERGHIFIQTEYCDGGSLASVLRKRRAAKRPFQEWELRRLCLQLAKGLQYMHSKRLVHLDIKPDNILIDLGGDSSAGSSPVAEEGETPAAKRDNVSSSSEDGRMNSKAEVDMTTCAAEALGCHKLESSSQKDEASSSKTPADDQMATPKTSKVKDPNTDMSSDSGHASDGCKCKAAAAVQASSSGDAAAITSTPINCAKHGRAAGANGNDCTVTPINNASTPTNSGGDKSPADCRTFYKLGDLGHVASLDSDYVPEEGDCRYMAPELLMDEADRERLPKADIFSLALTLYECATLTEMPKNSTDGGLLYAALRSGDPPGLDKRSQDFQHLMNVSLILNWSQLKHFANFYLTFLFKTVDDQARGAVPSVGRQDLESPFPPVQQPQGEKQPSAGQGAEHGQGASEGAGDAVGAAEVQQGRHGPRPGRRRQQRRREAGQAPLGGQGRQEVHLLLPTPATQGAVMVGQNILMSLLSCVAMYY